MSSILKSIYKFIFGGGNKTEVQTKAFPHEENDFNHHAIGWGKHWQENQEARIQEGNEGKLGIKSNFTQYEYFGDPPPENIHKSTENDNWDYGYRDFTDPFINGPNAEDSKERYDGIFTKGSEFLLHSNDNTTDEKDEMKGTDSLLAADKPDGGIAGPEIQETLSFLPDLSSDESSEYSTLKDEDCESEKVVEVEKAYEGTGREKLVSRLPLNDNLHVSTSLPSMPDLNSPGIAVQSQVMTVIPMIKVPTPQSGCKNADNYKGEGISSYLVVTGGGFSTPVNMTPEVPDVRLKPTTPSPAITETSLHQKLFQSCKTLTLDEMYKRFNQGNIQTPSTKHYTSPKRSPSAAIKKLMDVRLHSNLVYTSEANSVGIPPKSPVSSANPIFSSPNSCVRALGNTSSAPGKPAGRVVSSPHKTYLLKRVNKREAISMAATPIRKLVLMHGKVDSATPNGNFPVLPTVQGKTSSKTCKLVTTLPPNAAKKDRELKGEFATPKSSSSQGNQLKTRVTLPWTGTPRPAPAPKASPIAGSGCVGKFVEADSGKEVVKRAAKTSDLEKAAGSTFSSIATSTSLLGKRSKGPITMQDHESPMKKGATEGGITKDRNRRSSTRVLMSQFHQARALRSKTAVVSQKS